MKCPSEIVLREYLQGQVDVKSRDLLEAHFTDCHACAEALIRLTTIDKSETIAPKGLGGPDFFRGFRLQDEPVFRLKYDLCEEIGRGGMGVVYRALHKILGRKVAIKVTGPNADADRFKREARLLASIQSPFVVAVHDFDMLSNSRPMIVMEWVDGKNLAQFIETRGGSLSEDESTVLMRNVCEGMLAAENMKIIHRDLKPSNVLIDSQGRARVADFGLARDETMGDDLSHAGQVMGTYPYMAPEQFEDPRNIDTRADIYCFGATFYHALIGKPPFDGPTSYSVFLKHKTEKPVSLRSLRPELSKRICDVIERCLAKAPSERFASFADIITELRPPLPKPLVPMDQDVLPDPGNLRKYEKELGRVLLLNLTARTDGVVYGSDIYTSDSNLATAAVHAGVLVPGENSTVCVRIVAAVENFHGSKRNGVTSQNWNRSWHGAYHFVLADPGNLSEWEKEVDKVLFFDVTARTDGIVYGTDIYTSDSNLATTAVHAGVLGPGECGVVRVRVVPVPERYDGSTRNGVTSRSWKDSWRGAYQIERA